MNIGEAPITIPGTGTGTDLAGNFLDVLPEDIDPPVVQSAINTASVDCNHTYGSAPQFETTSYNYPYPENLSVHGVVLDESIPDDTLYGVDVRVHPEFLSQCEWVNAGRWNCQYYHGFWMTGYDNILGEDIFYTIGLQYPDETFASVSTLVDDIGMMYYFTDMGDYVLFIHNDHDEVDGLEWWNTIYVNILSREMEYEANMQVLCEGGTYLHAGGSNYTQVTAVEWYSEYQLVIQYHVATSPTEGYYDFIEFVLPNLSETSDDTACLLPISTASEVSDLTEEFQLELSLAQNPVQNSLNLSITIPEAGQATLQLFDISGRLVHTLLNEEISAGEHSVNWDTRVLSTGVYFVRLVTPVGTALEQMMVLH